MVAPRRDRAARKLHDEGRSVRVRRVPRTRVQDVLLAALPLALALDMHLGVRGDPGLVEVRRRPGE